MNYTGQLLRKFGNPIVAFLVLRYVRNDNKLHFHISLVMQKRRDNSTFLLDLVIKHNGYSAIKAKVLEL